MEYFVGNYADFSSLENGNLNNNNAAHFMVDDLLDFSKADETITDAFFDALGGNSGQSSILTAVESCNSSVSGGDAQFNGNVSCRSFSESQFCSNELCVPYDDLAELEWLSNFVEESFSTEDLHFIPTNTTAPSAAAKSSAPDTSSSVTTTQSPPIFSADVSVPGKARSKRSRAAPCDWSSRLLLVSHKTTPSIKKQPTDTPGRKCLHCASEKTPQWRTGPMGPKTLCNACGVRFKSGRLVPEYRPAASPTFVTARHSNSHRKVIELRRQKDLQRQQHHLSQVSIFNVSNGCDEFFIPHREGTHGRDFRHMI